jgi:hypothetical protein
MKSLTSYIEGNEYARCGASMLIAAAATGFLACFTEDATQSVMGVLARIFLGVGLWAILVSPFRQHS